VRYCRIAETASDWLIANLGVVIMKIKVSDDCKVKDTVNMFQLKMQKISEKNEYQMNFFPPS